MNEFFESIYRESNYGLNYDDMTLPTYCDELDLDYKETRDGFQIKRNEKPIIVYKIRGLDDRTILFVDGMCFDYDVLDELEENGFTFQQVRETEDGDLILYVFDEKDAETMTKIVLSQYEDF